MPFRLALVSLNGEGLWGEPLHYYNPLAITTLAGYVHEQLGEQVEVRLYDTIVGGFDPLMADLETFQPDLVGLSVKTDSLLELERMWQGLARKYTGPIVLGGIAPSVLTDELLESFPTAFLIRGEGEMPLVALVRALRGECSLEDVPNLVYRSEGKTIHNPVAPFDLAQAHHQPTNDFTDEIARTDGDFWLESSRSCQGRCSFCSKTTAHYGSRRHRRFPLARTLERIRTVHERDGIDLFRFADEDFFNNDFDFLRAFIGGMRALELPVRFELDARICDLYYPAEPPEVAAERRQIWRELRDAGLFHVFVGIESLSDSQLRRYQKDVTVAQVREAMRFLDELGVSSAAGFIAFDPFVTVEELAENFQNLRDTGIYRAVNTPIKVMRLQKKTLLAARARQAGLITGETPNRMSYTYRYAEPEVDRLATVLEGTAERFKRYALKLNYLIRPGATYSRVLPADLMRFLAGENERLKRMQVDYLIEAVRQPDEAKLQTVDAAFRKAACEIYAEIVVRSEVLPAAEHRERLIGLSREFIREMSD